MKQMVDNLVKLQEFDSRLHALTLQKGDLPVLIESLDDDLKDKKAQSSELQARIEKLQSDRRMFEKEVEASKAQLKKYDDQLYAVKNNKEYDAISLEIDTKKSEIEELENKIIQTIEEEDRLKQEIEDLSSELTDLDSQLKTNITELEEITKQTKEEEGRLVAERQGIAQKISASLLKRYERIRNAKSGLAVATIRRNSCNGCFSTLPPQLIVEVHKAERLINCEYCGRILVWEDEAQ